jgi:hypothetical protein
MEADPAENLPDTRQGSPKQMRAAAALAIGAARYLDHITVTTLLTDELPTLQGIPIGAGLIGKRGLDLRGIDWKTAHNDGMTCHGCLTARGRR